MGKNSLQGKIKEFGKMGKIREFYKNMSGKYQGIFSLFHNFKKITEMMLYMIKIATFFDENHLNYLYTCVCQTLQSFEHGQ